MSGTLAGVPPVVPAPRPSTAKGEPAVRDRWLDLLRAAALLRVVLYHLAGWVWLPAVLPAMGIMFGLAGSLMAASLTRSRGQQWNVVGRRMRRLLPPLWVMGALVVPVMIWHGWSFTATEGSALTWRSLLLWLLPLSDPPGSAWGYDWVVPLWYIRTYLWFVVLSPAVLWLFRRWSKRMLALPVAVLVLITTGLVEATGASGDIVVSLCTFGGCWMLGFAHRDGRLQALPWRRVAPAGLALMAAGLGWALTHQDPSAGWNLDEIPFAQALYSFGAVLLLFRASPSTAWLARRRLLSGLVDVANRRAVTIYLWNNVAIFLALPLADAWAVTRAVDDDGPAGLLLQFALTWLLLAAVVLALGWVEDVAARRPARLNPWPQRPAVPAGRPGRAVPAGPPRWIQIGVPAAAACCSAVVVLLIGGWVWPRQDAVPAAPGTVVDKVVPTLKATSAPASPPASSRAPAQSAPSAVKVVPRTTASSSRRAVTGTATSTSRPVTTVPATTAGSVSTSPTGSLSTAPTATSVPSSGPATPSTAPTTAPTTGPATVTTAPTAPTTAPTTRPGTATTAPTARPTTGPATEPAAAPVPSAP